MAFLCEQEQTGMAGWSPLTNELLALGENLTNILDYDDDPEVTTAIANIPHTLGGC